MRTWFTATVAFLLVAAMLFGNAVAHSSLPERTGPRVLQFSGYEWEVKTSDQRVGPGPNYFSDSSENVSVDEHGRLHLRILKRDGRWTCAEVISKRSFGYGTYRFSLNTPAGNLDPKVVLGMFTWHDDAAYSHREIDVEVSRWGRRGNQNAQFVVQPYTRRQNMVRFELPPSLAASTHSFTWKPESIFFQSVAGPAKGSRRRTVIRQHMFSDGIPKAGGENARINLWLMSGDGPSDGKDVEVVIGRFEFIPLQ